MTKMLTDADNAPTVTDKYAKCQVCGVTWQIKSPTKYDDAKGCSFCDAPADAIVIISEKPVDYSAIARRRF